MGMSKKASDGLQEIISGLQSMNNKIIRRDMQPAKTILADDNRGAMINSVVDKYFKKDLDDAFLRRVKEEYNISSRDIYKEIVKREFKKAFGA